MRDGRSGKAGERPALVLDCDECAMRATQACDGCVVSYLLDRPEGAVIFDVAEERAIRSMSGAGLLPGVRFPRRTG